MRHFFAGIAVHAMILADANNDQVLNETPEQAKEAIDNIAAAAFAMADSLLARGESTT